MTNHVVLRGFAADEPMIRATEYGRLARLRIATVEQLVSPRTGEVREHTEWHTISTFGENAVLIDHNVRIGTPIYIEGSLRTREWVDKSGSKRKTTEISATKVEILESIEGCNIPKKIRESMPSGQQISSQIPSDFEVKAPADDPDELPF